MAHSKAFYQKQYDKYKMLVEETGITPVCRNLNTFIENYNNAAENIKSGDLKLHRTITETIVYTEQYPTDFKVAAAFSKAIHAEIGDNVSVKALQTLEHKELVDMYAPLITNYDQKLKGEGKDSKTRRRMISAYFFGSK